MYQLESNCFSASTVTYGMASYKPTHFSRIKKMPQENTTQNCSTNNQRRLIYLVKYCNAQHFLYEKYSTPVGRNSILPHYSNIRPEEH